MSNKGCKTCLLFSCMFLWLPILIICPAAFLSARSERKKLDNYVQDDCLVIDSYWEPCGTTQSRQGERQCVQLNWKLQYLRYQSNKQTTITHVTSYLKKQLHMEDQIEIDLTKYQVCMLLCKTYKTCVEFICCVYRLMKSIHVIILVLIV